MITENTSQLTFLTPQIHKGYYKSILKCFTYITKTFWVITSVLEVGKYTILEYFIYNSLIFYAAAVSFEKKLLRDLGKNWGKFRYWSKELDNRGILPKH